MSRQTRPLESIEKSSSAPSSLIPPRLDVFAERLAISMRASSETRVPALSARAPSTRDFAGQNHGLRFCEGVGKSALDEKNASSRFAGWISPVMERV